MHELKISSYPELHAWSAQHRAEFWDMMIRRLGIRFREPYTQLVDLSQGAEFPKWLVNARFNIAESCFQAPDDAVAIIAQPEGGSLFIWTYGELQALSNRVANGLSNAGFQPGDAIAIAMPMTAESVAIYLGIVKAGCVVVSIADSFAASEIATRLRISKAKAIFTQDYILRHGKQLPLYDKVIDANAPMAIVLPYMPPSIKQLAEGSVVPTHSCRQTGDLSWDTFLSPNNHFDVVLTDSSAYTNILFSSGTTGEPKAIPWTQTTPIKCAVDGHLHHDIHPGNVVAWPTNLGWMMGPWLIYAAFINQAAIALYYGVPTQREFGQFVQDAHVNMLGIVPSLVNIWKTTNCMQGLDWSAIKAFSSTGECSNPQDTLFLMSLAGYKPIIEYCGGTEIGGGYITGTLVQPCAPSTFTTPALGLDIVILDEDGHPADQGEAFIIPPAIGLSTELLNKDHHDVYFDKTSEWGKELEVRSQESAGERQGGEMEGQESGVRSQESAGECQGREMGGQRDTKRFSLPLSPSPLPPLRRHGDQLERLANGYYRAHGRVDDTMNLGGIKISSTDIERTINTVEAIHEAAAIAISPPEGGPSQLVIYAVVTPTFQGNLDELQSSLQASIRQYLNPLFKIYDVVIVDALPRTASNKVMRRVLREQYRGVVRRQASGVRMEG
jgi:acetyl-CoA synthetase